LTRIYGPADFGGLALFTSFLNVTAVAVCLQYEVSIPSAQNETEAAYLVLAALLFALPASLLAAGVFWLLIHWSVLAYGSLPRGSPLLLILAMTCIGIFAALRYWCLREKHFGMASQGTAVQSAGRASLQVVFGAVGMHGAGLLLGEAIGRGIGMFRMFRSAWPFLRAHLRPFRAEEFARALWHNRKFPMYSLPSSFLDSLCVSLPVPLLIRLYGSSFGGAYSLVWRVLALPSVLLTVAIADTFHSHLAICAREAPDKVTRLFGRTSAGLLLVGSIPAVVLCLWGAPLFRITFGSRWEISGVIASIIAPWYLADFVVSPVSRVVLVLSGQEMKLIWDILCLGSLLAVFMLAQARAIAPVPMIRILTVVHVGLRGIYYVVLLRIIARFTRMQNAQAQPA
jgi:O-antigen/teichoic acid export membrane protein